MKKQVLKLNNDVAVDLEKLIESGMVILANSGGGKSYLIRRIAEQAVDKVQTIIIDPEGEFSSLREQYDFILCGKDADVPAEPRSAALLATKLLELNKSAVIDLYELHPQERQRFVKIFCDALVNCPKALYHPVLIVLDEAHEYVPEGKPSEATWSVELLASKGRKRGQRLILASQRLSKISKNATAECNNKLIGRASQDIDMKRAGDELGFSKEKLVQIRQLKPGEFFAFGPAISDEVIKLQIGPVKTAHAKVGYKGTIKTPPPSEVIKKVLSALKDLPQEAANEAKTMQEMKQQITQLKRELTQSTSKKEVSGGFDQKFVEKEVKEAVLNRDKQWKKYTDDLEKNVTKIATVISSIELNLLAPKPVEISQKQVFKPAQIPIPQPKYVKREVMHVHEISPVEDLNSNFGKCAKAIYSYLNMNPPEPRTKTQIAVAVGYSQNSGGFNNSISELSAAGLIIRENGSILSVDGRAGTPPRQDLIIPVDISLEKWLSKLGACSRTIWHFLLKSATPADDSWVKEKIAEDTGYSVSSGGFNNSLSELSALGLIERMPGGMVRINPEILNL